MDETTYKSLLTKALESSTDIVVTRLDTLMANLPEKTQDISIGVHAGDDPEGFFDVTVHLGGPDLYVLNKAVSEYRSLFEVRVEPSGKVSHGLSTFDPFDEDFRGGDIIVDTVAEWMRGLWPRVDLHGFSGPVMVFGDNDFGSKPSWKL